jgi:hypothetical protein
MPRDTPAGLRELFARPNARFKSHTTLQINIDNDDLLRTYHFASAKLFFDGVHWTPLLKQASEIKSSLTPSSDQATVELMNADTEIGREFLGLGQTLNGAETLIGRYWLDLDSGAEFHDVLQSGLLITPTIDENVVSISSVSEPYANISVGASRRVALPCQWQFRNPFTCGYAGSLLTCNFLLNHTDGCEGRHGGGVGDSQKRAKFGGFAFLSSGSRLKTI